MKDFGYDVSDYSGVDPMFGTLADFDALLAGAHARGLKVIIDQVWSHTSDRHPWFAESAASRGQSEVGLVRLGRCRNPMARRRTTGWRSFGGRVLDLEPGAAAVLSAQLPGASSRTSTSGTPRFSAAILDVARFWLDRGVDGFRLDVINFIVHDAELRDNPPRGS